MAMMRGPKASQMMPKRRRMASEAPATMMATKVPSAPMMAPSPASMGAMAPAMKKGGRVKEEGRKHEKKESRKMESKEGSRKKGGLMVVIALGKKKGK